MYQLHDLLFREEFNTIEGFEHKLIYARAVDEIMTSLEDFRTQIYGKKAKEEYNPTAIVGQFISFKDKDSEE